MSFRVLLNIATGVGLRSNNKTLVIFAQLSRNAFGYTASEQSHSGSQSNRANRAVDMKKHTQEITALCPL